MSVFFINSLILFFPTSRLAAQTLLTPTNCNTPLVGVGRVVDNIPGNLASILSGTPALDNLVDGDLSNYVTFNTTIGLLSATPLISIKDMQHYFPTGTRAGFVIQSESGLLSASVLSGFSINTYKNNVIQETVSGSSLSLIKMEMSGGKQRISFITTKDFDEIELVENTTLSIATALRVYYAFVEPAAGCNYDCVTPLTGSGATVSKNLSGVLCLSCHINNENNITDGDLTNSANMLLTLGLVETGTVSVKYSTAFPAGSDAGFVLSNGGVLLSASVLGATSISTYNGGTFQESVSLGSIANVNILSGNLQELSFNTTKQFDEIRLTSTSTLSLGINIDIYYAFVRLDSDNDGTPDCADKCAGSPDYLDYNGNGIPDGCDPPCTLNAGPDIALCSQQTTYDFSSLNLGSGLTWSILPQSPSGASVNSTGLVSGMTQTGVYYIQVSNGSCSDIVTITRRDALVNPACNNPISGPGTKVFYPQGESCLLCINTGTSGDPNNLIDGDLSNYILASNLVSLLISNPIIGVRDTTMTYPAGTRTGFVVQPVGGLINTSLLSGIVIKTYKNGVFQEAASGGGLVLSAGVAGGSTALQRIGFVTTKPFDAVVLYAGSALSILTGLRIYYAFEEPQDGCQGSSLDCIQLLSANNRFKAQLALNNGHTGFAGVACVNCNITNLGNLIDSDPATYTNIHQTLGLASRASVSVKTLQTITSGNNQVGFVISSPANLLNVSVLQGLSIHTYLNGTPVESHVVDGSLIGLSLLDESTNKVAISFTPTSPFNEIQLTLDAALGAITDLNVYGAFILPDSDGDGVPDCMDKCCLGPDNLDQDGDGIPDACSVTVIEDASCILCPVLVTISGPGLSSGQTYALFDGSTNLGVFNSNSLTFTPSVSGLTPYSVRASKDGVNYTLLKDVVINVHPASARWNANVANSIWNQGSNWIAGDSGQGSFPTWCTDVTIPGSTSTFPSVQAGDQSRDIHFENGASVGKIQLLKYRHAYVDLFPSRNQWIMLSAPLKFMYSADYAADYDNWSNAISPKIFMRYFDIQYATSGKLNPDGVAGTSNGNFSRAFAELNEKLDPAAGFVLWVNGSPYPNVNFGDNASFYFPRRNADSTDVRYSFHNTAGTWVGEPFKLARGNNIKEEGEWTSTSIPDKNNRYRFIYEDLMTPENDFSVLLNAGHTGILGNPFMSHLDFDQFYLDNSGSIYNYYRIWDGDQFYSYITGGGGQSWTGLGGLSSSNDTGISQYIAPMQAFFVETKGSSGQVPVKFTLSSSASAVNNELRSDEAKINQIRLSLKVGDKEGHTLLAAIPGASDRYIPGEDIYKLFSPFQDVPEIYTVADKTAIEINLINSDAAKHTIPLGIKTSQTGLMELNISDMDDFTLYPEVYLIDAQENKNYDLRKIQKISFMKSSPENLEGRFYISLNSKVTTSIDDVNDRNSLLSVTTDGTHISVSSPEDVIKSIELYDLSGSLQYKINNKKDYYLKFDIGHRTGIYILRVETMHNSGSFKLIFY